MPDQCRLLLCTAANTLMSSVSLLRHMLNFRLWVNLLMCLRLLQVCKTKLVQETTGDRLGSTVSAEEMWSVSNT